MVLRPILVALAVTSSAAFSLPAAPAISLSQSFGSRCSLQPSIRRPCGMGGSLRMSVDPAAVQALVDKANAATGGEKAPSKLSKALKKATGAITVSIEYSDIAGLSATNGVDFRTLSMILRRDGSSAIFVDTSNERGLVDCANFVKEQASAKGKFPGSLPVIATGNIDTVEQVAKAKAAGADGVYISAGSESLIKACHALDMESIVEVNSKQQIESAVASGAKILCVYTGGDDVKPSVALRSAIPAEIVALGALQGRGYGGPKSLFEKPEAKDPEEEKMAEILTAGFELRDAKFNGLLVKSACINADDKEEVSYARWLSTQLATKRSVQFSKIAKTSSPMGTGRPPAPLEGFNTVLEGSRPSR